MALDFGNKTANDGATAQGRLSASEFNSLVAAVNANETTIGAKADKVQEVEVTGATPTQELAPNTMYKFTGQVTSLTLTLGTPISGVTNIYGFSFTAGAANPTITWPQGCKLDGEPTLGAGDYFEATIQDGYVLYKIWKASTT